MRRGPVDHGLRRLRRVLRRGRALSTIRIPPTLRGETEGAREVEARGGTVRELLDDLMSRFPALRGQLLEGDAELAPFVNVYVEGEDVRTRQGLDTPVGEGSQIVLLPAMAGGAMSRGQSLGRG
ncbi:MAG TPA: ubiquitin-like small modifier protein 1 [Gaiellaceae bacterium]|nr:ubiquitin-like small modifier protein 1 [Gaiellaceae bacterium]